MSKGLLITDATDENLKLIRDEDGTDTALELSKDQLKINGDLTCNDLVCNDLTLNNETRVATITNSTFTTPSDYSFLLGSTGQFRVGVAGESTMEEMAIIDVLSSKFELSHVLDPDDYFRIQVLANGAAKITCFDSEAGGDADLEIAPNGNIYLNATTEITIDSATGNFIASKQGTEFSATNSSYAGMMLGCTSVFGSGTTGTYKQVTTALTNLVWDTDKYALVTFVVPPSNKVEIRVHLPYAALSGNLFYLALGTDSSATSLGSKYYNKVWDVDESDIIGIEYSWVVDGSDHSWSAGETKTLYILAYASGVTRIYTGGTNTGYFGDIKVQAIALPATIGDGSEP